MVLKEIAFPISESAKKREAVVRALAGLALFGLVTAAFAPMIPKLLEGYKSPQFSQRLIDVAVIVLVVMLWLGIIGVIVVSVRDRDRMFRRFTGSFTINDVSITFGDCQIERSAIETVTRKRRVLDIHYFENGKKWRLKIPLAWLPKASGDQIERAIRTQK